MEDGHGEEEAHEQEVDGEGGADEAQGAVSAVDDEATEAEYLAAIAERDARIDELQAQVAEAFKSVEAAEALAAQIEELRAQADAERLEFELASEGCRSAKAARALLEDHGGDVQALKAAEPWLFTAARDAGATGLEPAGAAAGGEALLAHWREVAGLAD